VVKSPTRFYRWLCEAANAPQIHHKLSEYAEFYSADSPNICNANQNSRMPEFIDPIFAKECSKHSFSMTENERFGLVFAKTGSINSGTELFSSTTFRVLNFLSFGDINRYFSLIRSGYSCCFWNRECKKICCIFRKTESSSTYLESLMREKNNDLYHIAVKSEEIQKSTVKSPNFVTLSGQNYFFLQNSLRWPHILFLWEAV
jgi:hypothetical protein